MKLEYKYKHMKTIHNHNIRLLHENERLKEALREVEKACALNLTGNASLYNYLHNIAKSALARQKSDSNSNG